MFSHPVGVGAPVVGFVLGLVVTYAVADAGPGPTPAGLLQDKLVSRISIGSEIGEGRFASFDQRFSGDRDARKNLLEGSYRVASLGAPVGPVVLVDAGSIFAPSSGGSVFSKPSNSFAERFAGIGHLEPASFARPPESSVRPPTSSWVVQLIGDDSEAIAVSRFRELQSKHKSILGIYQPLVVTTTLSSGSRPIWTRVRVGLNSRQAADVLCSQLESAGERCVVQPNISASSGSKKEIEAAKVAPPADQRQKSLASIT
jgi:SPOR domain